MKLRDYQLECVEETIAKFRDGCRSAMIVMPTGSGKTVVFGEIANRWPGRTIVVAHREELIFQAQRTLQQITGEPVAVEMAELKALGSRAMTGDPFVVVASIQSLHARRIKRFNPERYDLLIVDEAHHCVPKNKTYRRVVEHFRQNPNLRICGVTATADRFDEEALGQMFDEVTYEMGIKDGIDKGWLVPIRQQMVYVEDLDLANVKTAMGDLQASELDRIFSEEKICHRVVAPLLEIAGDRRTLVFTAGVRQAHRTAEILNRHRPGCAVAMDGKTEKDIRRQELARYSRGEFQYLVNCALYLEGYNECGIECIAQARPTKSRALYTQIIGRSTRVLPGVIEGGDNGEFWRIEDPDERKEAISKSKKKASLIVDFVGNAGRHKLVYTGDILGGHESDEVLDEANRLTRKAGREGESVDVEETLRLARERVEEEHKRKRAALVAKARYRTRTIDPFDVFDFAMTREPGWHKGREPSSKQRAMIQKAGVTVTFHKLEWWLGAPKDGKKLSFWRASQIIGKLVDRRKKNMATLKQANLLLKFGENPDVSFIEAGKIIDEIAKRGWKPRHVAR